MDLAQQASNIQIFVDFLARQFPTIYVSHEVTNIDRLSDVNQYTVAHATLKLNAHIGTDLKTLYKLIDFLDKFNFISPARSTIVNRDHYSATIKVNINLHDLNNSECVYSYNFDKLMEQELVKK